MIQKEKKTRRIRPKSRTKVREKRTKDPAGLKEAGRRREGRKYRTLLPGKRGYLNLLSP